jgi:sugar diacid utilization regulator
MTPSRIAGGYRDAVVSPAARDLAAGVHVELVAGQVHNDIMADVWPQADDPGFGEAVHSSVSENLDAIFSIMAGRAPLDVTPQAPLTLAEVTAQLDVPITELERAYRIGVTSLWTRWFDLAREHSQAQDASFEELISGPTLAIHSYVDHILASVVARHEETHGELHRTRRDLRRLTLTQLIDGTIDEATEELNASLDYGVGDTHVALLVETTDGREPCRETIGTLRAAADARGTLLLQHGPRSWVVWLGRPAGYGPAELSRLRRALAHTELTAAVGEPAAGLAGLRRTRQQAIEAARVQHALGPTAERCLWARDVRLEALLLSDEQRARSFLADELGGLASSDPTTMRLRETLLAWLATGSHVSAAAMLGVHENTVRNRIRSAEEILGAPLLPRRTELQVALRLERVLSAAQQTAPA